MLVLDVLKMWEFVSGRSGVKAGDYVSGGDIYATV